ncbi:putative immunity protein [Kribbella qitaiheensis]|uniref:putative immunity protein n=1 Tax=Kribbella qitaiheensis TaxID=1544730 RepID=UPI0019D4FAB0|nr:hypothetical protein [Kribbella qitaiheensis]
MALDPQLHQALAIWATACAEHVLGNFERVVPDDARPREAIEAGRAWVRGELKMTDARKAAFAAHAAAREAPDAAATAAGPCGRSRGRHRPRVYPRSARGHLRRDLCGEGSRAGGNLNR